jgi:GSH-dependent disulfide-bond oxidoreductase
MTKPIDLYYWPTPNGHKITIFLEESGTPYQLHPVNITRGDQFKPGFLAISPNNKMPAIVDPDGPGGDPLSVFESGAILRYLAEKTGRFYASDVRARTLIDQWLFWQVGGLGPMAGQAGHFRNYAREKIPYAIDRYTNEVHRLYGVLDGRLAEAEFLAGAYSIADIASYPWALIGDKLGIELGEFPHVQRWLATIGARPAVVRAYEQGKELTAAQKPIADDDEAQKVLFGQRARPRT